jgi:hypothetical protein
MFKIKENSVRLWISINGEIHALICKDLFNILIACQKQKKYVTERKAKRKMKHFI